MERIRELSIGQQHDNFEQDIYSGIRLIRQLLSVEKLADFVEGLIEETSKIALAFTEQSLIIEACIYLEAELIEIAQ